MIEMKQINWELDQIYLGGVNLDSGWKLDFSACYPDSQCIAPQNRESEGWWQDVDLLVSRKNYLESEKYGEKQENNNGEKKKSNLWKKSVERSLYQSQSEAVRRNSVNWWLLFLPSRLISNYSKLLSPPPIFIRFSLIFPHFL